MRRGVQALCGAGRFHGAQLDDHLAHAVFAGPGQIDNDTIDAFISGPLEEVLRGAQKRDALFERALLQAGAFTALTDPWVHGALFMAFAVAGLGLFVLLSWLLARALGPRQALPLPPETQADSTASSLSQPSRHGDEAAAVAELPGRARVAR